MEDIGSIIGVVLVIFVLSVLVGLLGKKRKIGFGWSFGISLILGPIIGLIITLISKKKYSEFLDDEFQQF